MAQVNYSKNGLVFIKKETGSAVTSINIDNCFSSTYSQYKIVIQLTTVSANIYPGIRLRTGGTTESGSVYNTQGISAASTSIASSRNTSATTFLNNSYNLTGTNSGCSLIEIMNPFQNTNTTGFILRSDRPEHSLPELVFETAGTDATTSFDGVAVVALSGTLTGTVYVYGYVES